MATSSSTRCGFVLSRTPLSPGFSWIKPGAHSQAWFSRAEDLMMANTRFGHLRAGVLTVTFLRTDRQPASSLTLWCGMGWLEALSDYCLRLAGEWQPQGLIVTLCSVTGPEDCPLSLSCSDACRAGDIHGPEKAARILGLAIAACCPQQGKPVGHEGTVPEQER